MTNPTSRRTFFKKLLILSSTIATAPNLLFIDSEKHVNIPLIDYHVHLSRNFSIEQAVKLAKDRNIKFGIVEHPGYNYKLRANDQLQQYINHLRQYPVLRKNFIRENNLL